MGSFRNFHHCCYSASIRGLSLFDHIRSMGSFGNLPLLRNLCNLWLPLPAGFPRHHVTHLTNHSFNFLKEWLRFAISGFEQKQTKEAKGRMASFGFFASAICGTRSRPDSPCNDLTNHSFNVLENGFVSHFSFHPKTEAVETGNWHLRRPGPILTQGPIHSLTHFPFLG
jgi:hypothetical protein